MLARMRKTNGKNEWYTKSIYLIAALALMLSGILAVSMSGTVKADSSWYDGNWAKVRPITIDNTGNPSDLIDYQVTIYITYDSDMQSDFDDLRFTDSDGTTELNYWIENKTDSSWAVIWVKVPSIPSSSTKAIYVYFGNPSAISVSSFYDTFPGVVITPDGNTLLLDHLDSSTVGVANGTFSYTNSLSNLATAPNFQEDGAYIKYQTGTSTGTIELWIKPNQYGGILHGNWYDLTSYPYSGKVLHFQINEDGKLKYSQWRTAGFELVGNTTIPLNEWTHVACSFGNYVKLYVNGKVDAEITPSANQPSWSSSDYLYLRYFGEDIRMKGIMDELHVSGIQRTDEEIRSHFAKYTSPEPTITVDEESSLPLPSPSIEVGGNVYSINKLVLFLPTGILAITILSVSILVYRWRHIQ